MKNSESRFMKHLKWFHPVEAIKVVHCANARYALIFLASIFVVGDVFGVDVEPELLHFDCKRIDSRFKQSLEIDSRYTLIDASGGKIWCKDSAEMCGRFFTTIDVGNANGVVKTNASDVKSKSVGNNSAEQSASNTESARNKGNSVGSKFHDVMVILAGGFGGIALGLLIVWAVLRRLTNTPNVAGNRPAAGRSG